MAVSRDSSLFIAALPVVCPSPVDSPSLVCVCTVVRGRQDLNFSLFNFVAEQSNEIERLEDTLSALKLEEIKLTQETGDDVSQVRGALPWRTA